MRTQIQIMLLCLLLLGLSGCSSKFAYNNADWLSNWYMDDYLDLSNEQNKILSAELEAALHWHRTTQLALYKQQLLDLSNDLNTLPISEQIWREHITRITGHWHEARNEFSDRAAKLAPLLTPSQVEYLFKKMQQKNAQQLETFTEQTLSQYKQERLEKILDTAEDLLGTISAQQILEVTTYNEHVIVTEQEWHDSKQAMQAAMQTAFNQHTQQQLSAALFELMTQPDQFKSEAFLQARMNNRTHLIAMLHTLSASLSPKQIKHFKKVIAERIELIESLQQG